MRAQPSNEHCATRIAQTFSQPTRSASGLEVGKSVGKESVRWVCVHRLGNRKMAIEILPHTGRYTALCSCNWTHLSGEWVFWQIRYRLCVFVYHAWVCVFVPHRAALITRSPLQTVHYGNDKWWPIIFRPLREVQIGRRLLACAVRVCVCLWGYGACCINFDGRCKRRNIVIATPMIVKH